MLDSFKTIALVARHDAIGIEQTVFDIAQFLRLTGHKVIYESQTAALMSEEDAVTPPEIGQYADLAIVIGGDGTMLGIARQLACYSIPLIGINHGRLGFMTDIPRDRIVTVLSDMLEGKFEREQRSLLEGSVVRAETCIFSALAFNDVVVSRGTGAGMVELRVDVDNRFMYNQRSDGLIVSTPTGSTAYSLSAGGPLLHPSVRGLLVVPIAPHALSNRPIVVPDSSEIMIEVVRGHDVSVNFDMQSFAHLVIRDRIIIKRSEQTVTFLHPLGWSYYDTLREKLHWNEYPLLEGQLK